MLVAFRLVQAAGAALLTPTSLGLVLASYEPERRQGAVRACLADPDTGFEEEPRQRSQQPQRRSAHRRLDVPAHRGVSG